MREEYCQSCNEILRFPESARKVICPNCDSEWQVVRTGSMLSLAPAGSMQTVGQEETLQKKMKEAQRQALIKEDHCRKLQDQIEAIVVEFAPVPLPAKLGAVVVMLFFLAGAAGAKFFGQPIVVPAALIVLAVAPFVGIAIYGRQINAREREKLMHKKGLIQELAQVKREIAVLQAKSKAMADETVIEE